MRKVIGGALAALWLVASVAIWSGQVQFIPSLSARHAIGLSAAQAVLLSYHLASVLQTLAGAFVSLAFGGLLAGAWLLVDGLSRRVRLTAAVGGAIAVLELTLGVLGLLRAALVPRSGATAAGLLGAASVAGQLAAEVIPAALLLALGLGAILIAGPRPQKGEAAPPDDAAEPGQRDPSDEPQQPERAEDATPQAE